MDVDLYKAFSASVLYYFDASLRKNPKANKQTHTHKRKKEKKKERKKLTSNAWRFIAEGEETN